MTDHTCSYYCDRPDCIVAQRDELRAKLVKAEDRLNKLLQEYEDMANQAIFNNDFKDRLAKAIEEMPFGDTAASFAAFVRAFK